MKAFWQDWLPKIQPLASLDAVTVLTTLLIASLCALVIYVTYRYFYKGVIYNVNFNLLIVMVCVVTAFVIITIGSNLVLSLGMVGALSIVRFRAAVKDPLDVGFLFWGVAAGLTAGAGLYPVALIGTAFIAVLYIGLTLVRLERRNYLMIIRYAANADETVTALIKPLKTKLMNKTLTDEYTELTAEVKVHKGDASFLDPIKQTTGVSCAMLVEYNGDFN